MKLLQLCLFVVIVVKLNIEKSLAQILDFSLNNPIKDALFLHNTSISNNTISDCLWRNGDDIKFCDDSEVKFFLYSNSTKEAVDLYKSDWLRQSNWNSNNENILLIHGYAGGDDLLPLSLLRDAYNANGVYNVWVVDWGGLSKPPCYRAAVYNMKMVARCAANLLTAMRGLGLRTERTSCVGHSLGAHVCGLISRYVKFRIHRIVGLDPARPLVPSTQRLDDGNALAVHILHTSAGSYGEMGRSGHVDFCINGGRTQPYCEKTESESLCSHIWVICYMAESLNSTMAMKAEPCTRRCPNGPRPINRPGLPVMMGQLTPLDSQGSYCVNNRRIPYCPQKEGDPGDKRCCIN